MFVNDDEEAPETRFKKIWGSGKARLLFRKVGGMGMKRIGGLIEWQLSIKFGTTTLMTFLSEPEALDLADAIYTLMRPPQRTTDKCPYCGWVGPIRGYTMVDGEPFPHMEPHDDERCTCGRFNRPLCQPEAPTCGKDGLTCYKQARIKDRADAQRYVEDALAVADTYHFDNYFQVRAPRFARPTTDCVECHKEVTRDKHNKLPDGWSTVFVQKGRHEYWLGLCPDCAENGRLIGKEHKS